MSLTPTDAASSEQALARDLALVLPTLAGAAAADVAPPAADPATVARVAGWIHQAQAPAVVGLSGLSIEACREAVALAERARARLLPWPAPAGGLTDPPSAAMTVSLGQLFRADLIVWVGCHGTTNAITRTIAAHQLLASFAPADLDTVLRLRQAMAADPAAEPLGVHRRVGVVLGAGVDPRVASQWHKLAAQIQEHVRLAVFSLPDLERAGNLRGALEVIAWQTGQSCARGGVDFADGSPRPCADAATLLARGAIDLWIDAAFDPPAADPTKAGTSAQSPPVLAGRVRRKVLLGGSADRPGPTADEVIHIPLPPLGSPFAARVMRCDGVILWTCPDPAAAPPDPAAALLRGVTQALEIRP